jgi:predicted transcriptional regulator of viral defense system
MENIISYIINNGGFATMKELKDASFHTRKITKLVEDGVIEKIKSGVYRISDIGFFKNVNLSLIAVCKAEPKAVICLISALDYYEMTDFNPHEIYYAIPNSRKSKRIKYPPTRVFYFRDNVYNIGIDVIKTKYGEMKIYNREKTVCDMFRYRYKIGEDLALESLKNYIRMKKRSIPKLLQYAETCRVKRIIEPILKGFLTQ